MKIAALFLLFFSMRVFAVDFSCSSYGLIDVFVKGTVGENYEITIIDLPFTEKKETIKQLDLDIQDDYSKFFLSATDLNNNQEWFITINTENNSGWIEMDYRGLMKQHEEIHCSFKK